MLSGFEPELDSLKENCLNHLTKAQYCCIRLNNWLAYQEQRTNGTLFNSKHYITLKLYPTELYKSKTCSWTRTNDYLLSTNLVNYNVAVSAYINENNS